MSHEQQRIWWHDDFLDEDFPRSPLLTEDLLDAGEKMIVYGPSESGKSYLVLQLAFELASVGSFFGFDVTRKCRVLVFQSELSISRYQERYAKIATSYPNNLEIALVTIEDLKLDYREGQDAFYEYVTQVNPDVVILDPLRAFFSGDENNSESVERFFTCVAGSQTEEQFTLIYVHHVRKGMIGFQDDAGDKASARGSGLITDRPSTAMSLTTNDAQTQWNLQFTKTRNRTRHPEALKLRVNYETGLFEIHQDLDPATMYVDMVMRTLDGGEMQQAEVQRRLVEETGANKRTIYDWIVRAEQRGVLSRHQVGGAGSPYILRPQRNVEVDKKFKL